MDLDFEDQARYNEIKEIFIKKDWFQFIRNAEDMDDYLCNEVFYEEDSHELQFAYTKILNNLIAMFQVFITLNPRYRNIIESIIGDIFDIIKSIYIEYITENAN